MNKKKRILVSGGSIAGLTLTYWLHQAGFEVTVLERSEQLRLGGQNIDVKGPGWEVFKKMGIAEKVIAANTTEMGIQFINERNRVVAEFPTDDALSMTQEIEILRGDLVNILFTEVQDSATFYFGDEITSVIEQADETEVTFKNRHKETFNLVIVAEGIGSGTRQLIFGNEIKFDYTGLYSAYLTIQKAESDSRWARWRNATGAIVFLIRPDNHGSTRVCIFFRSPERGYEKLSVAQQKELLITKIEDVGWEAPRIAEEIRKSDDLYFERVSQVKAPRWHKGKVAMVGDAAYCVTPLAGKGTDLAVAGAYVLAGELSQNDDYEKAFETYEARLRPYVNRVQKLPPGVPRLAYPNSKVGVSVLNFLFSVAGSTLFKKIVKLFGNDKKQANVELDLPDYKF